MASAAGAQPADEAAAEDLMDEPAEDLLTPPAQQQAAPTPMLQVQSSHLNSSAAFGPRVQLSLAVHWLCSQCLGCHCLTGPALGSMTARLGLDNRAFCAEAIKEDCSMHRLKGRLRRRGASRARTCWRMSRCMTWWSPRSCRPAGRLRSPGQKGPPCALSYQARLCDPSARTQKVFIHASCQCSSCNPCMLL